MVIAPPNVLVSLPEGVPVHQLGQSLRGAPQHNRIRVIVLRSSCTIVRSGARSNASIGPLLRPRPNLENGFFKGVHHAGKLVPDGASTVTFR